MKCHRESRTGPWICLVLAWLAVIGCVSVPPEDPVSPDGTPGASPHVGRAQRIRKLLAAEDARVDPRPAPAVARAAPYRLTDDLGLDPQLAARRVSLALDDVEVSLALTELASLVGLELVMDGSALDGLSVTLALRQLPLGTLLVQLEALLPLRFHAEGSILRVERVTGPRLSLLVYPLPGGLVTATLPRQFESLRELSFVSQSQRQKGGGDSGYVGSSEPSPSMLGKFLERIPELLPWVEGSTWYLDPRRNLLFIRGSEQCLDQAEACLAEIAQPPPVVEIEAHFLELGEAFSRDFGVELGLLEDFALDREGRAAKSVIGGDSTTRFAIPPQLPGVPTGLTLVLRGIMTEPALTVLLRAVEEDSESRVLSAPAVTTVNNSRATIAITRNLPFVEGYTPVFNRSLVASEGVASSQTEVALVATINDSNFTGIVLDVTPSVGYDTDRVHLRIQPVIRDQVGSITISSGAVVEGVETPAITRPIIETRYLDTQLVIPVGATAVLGGLKRAVERTEVKAVPYLHRIPLVGRLFRRETTLREERNLVILVTARLAPWPGARARPGSEQPAGDRRPN